MKKNESSVEYISTPHNVEQRGGERCSNKKVLYVDMDNVLVNFQSGIDALNEDLKSRYAGCYDEVPNIFAKMQPNEGAIDAMNRLKDKYDIYILSTAIG